MEDDIETRVNFVEGTKRWTIHKFSMLSAEIGAVVQSPAFRCAGETFQLELYPGGEADEDKGYVSLFLCRPQSDEAPVEIQLSIRLLNDEDDVLFATRLNSTFALRPGSPNAKGVSQLVDRRGLVNRLGANDRLVIEAVIQVMGELKHGPASNAANPAKLDAKLAGLEVAADLGKVLDEGLHSDVTLYVDGEEIAVHKAILAGRSPVLKVAGVTVSISRTTLCCQAMFAHEMKESLEGKVEIDDMRAPVMKQLVRFLYTGQCSFENAKVRKGKGESKEAKKEEILDMPTHLLAAADRFQVPRLAELAVEALMSSVTVENVADRLLMADACHSQLLKNRCLDFIRRDPRRATEMMESDGYQKLSQSLLQDVVAALAPPSSKSKKRKREDEEEPLTKDKIKKLKVSELKTELTQRGMDASGNRAALIERLERAVFLGDLL